MKLENETFLSELTSLFAANRSKGGSLCITLKRYDGRTKPKPRKQKGKGEKTETKEAAPASTTQPAPEFNKCLIRAHLGDKKISTVINAKDVNKFQLAYSNLLKGNFYGLKKRKREKKVGIDK